MLRCLRPALAAVWLLAGSVSAEPVIDDLARVLMLDRVVEVMHEEGLAYGDGLDADMLDGQGGTFFRDQVRTAYEPARMRGFVTEALKERLDPDEIDDVMAFFGSDLGQHILSLEIAARIAMSDPEVEEIARQTYRDLLGSDDSRLGLVSVFVAVNDLLERNVASGLSSDYHFLRGLTELHRPGLSDGELLADVWSQESALREETETWLFGFLLMAYRPLTDAELEAYIAFSETPAGQSLNAALFDGFDTMYRAISYRLGRATAQALDASDI